MPHLNNRLGDSGLNVSRIGIGLNNLGRKNSFTETQSGSSEVVHAAIASGINFLDVADVYNNGIAEEFLGNALVGKRHEVILATKFGMDARGLNGPDFSARGSRKYIIQAIEASLKRLKTDYIDLYQYHTPDAATPIEETLRALDDLITSGKVRYIGHSNHAGWQIAKAHYVAHELGTHHFISAQNHYNLLDRRAELEVLPAAQEFGLGILPYFPLANGLLTGKYRRDFAPEQGRITHSKPDLLKTANWEQLEAFANFAENRGKQPFEVALSWLAAQEPVASVIAGATTVAQVEANAAAIFELTPGELAELTEIFPAPARIALF